MTTSHLSAHQPSRIVTSTDGVDLAVYESGAPDGPIVLLIHGYPDDHTVWDGVAWHLGDRFRVVTYDVRGSGRSGRPRATAAYRIPQLVDDLAAVLDVVAPDDGVHLIGHDWGSVQTWDALGDRRFTDRVASFTSISGPSLDMVAVWFRGARRNTRPVLQQLRGSSYMPLLQMPVVPHLLVRTGLVSRGIALSSSRGNTGGSSGHTVAKADALAGTRLYQANLARRLRAPRPVHTSISVQVLAPSDDLHVTVACQTEAPAPFVSDLRTRVVDGNHWVVAQHPEVVAACFADFFAGLDSGPVIERRWRGRLPFAR